MSGIKDARWEAMARAFKDKPVECIANSWWPWGSEAEYNAEMARRAELKRIQHEAYRKNAEEWAAYNKAHKCQHCGAPIDNDGKYDEPYANTGW